MSVVDVSFGHPMKVEEEATAPLAGGIMDHGFQCGMLWGASLAAGAEAYRRFGTGAKAETAAIMATDRLVETFQNRTQNEVNCTEITETSFQQLNGFRPILKYVVKGGKIGPGSCFRLAAGYARDAFETIGAALSEEALEKTSAPVSCSAVLARKMGASDKHAVMASGFAGGLSLSGGGCGVLAAAIWLAAMNSRKEGERKIEYSNNVKYQAVIDHFVESTDCEFECRHIVGRHFASIEEHAEYLRQGGCSELIEALADRTKEAIA